MQLLWTMCLFFSLFFCNSGKNLSVNHTSQVLMMQFRMCPKRDYGFVLHSHGNISSKPREYRFLHLCKGHESSLYSPKLHCSSPVCDVSPPCLISGGVNGHYQTSTSTGPFQQTYFLPRNKETKMTSVSWGNSPRPQPPPYISSNKWAWWLLKGQRIIRRTSSLSHILSAPPSDSNSSAFTQRGTALAGEPGT